MRLLKKVKNSAVYYAARIFFRLFNIIPRNPAQFCGQIIGYTAYLLSTKDRLKAMRHLKMVYGDTLSYSQRQIIVRNLYRNFGRNIIDFVRFKKHFKKELLPLIKTEGMEHFDKVYNRGKGVIGVTGHIGNFELLAAYFAQMGYKAAAIGREMYDKRLDKILVENRAAMGLENIDTDSKRVRGQHIPAFGRLSNTPVGQTILGLKTGAGFVPVACVRFGQGFKIIVKPEITVERSNNFDKDVYNITKRCTAALEEIINEYRDQWIWIHNRWLTRPE